MDFIKPYDIRKHIALTLPYYTDLFSIMADVQVAEIISSDTVRVTTVSPHNLSVSKLIMCKNGKIKNKIVSGTMSDDYVVFKTEYNHDFTLQNNSIEIIGFTDSIWNGTHELVNVPNRQSLTINKPEGAISPVLTGSEAVYENRPFGINGSFVVTNIVSDTIFEYQISERPDLPINTISDLSVATGWYIFTAANFVRAQQLYTKNNKTCLFLIMTDADITKSSRSLGPASAIFQSANINLLNIIQNFSTTVFINTTENINGEAAQNLAYEEIFEALLRTLYCYNPTTQYSVVSNGHGQGEYNTSFYTHVYDWQLPYSISNEDGVENLRNVAFRNLDYDLEVTTVVDGQAGSISLTINLDETPTN